MVKEFILFPVFQALPRLVGMTIHTGEFAQPDGINANGSFDYPIIHNPPPPPDAPLEVRLRAVPYSYEIGPTKKTGTVFITVGADDFDYKDSNGIVRTYRPLGLESFLVVKANDHSEGINLQYPIGAGLVPILNILCWPVLKGWNG